jgi:hypothetical protein
MQCHVLQARGCCLLLQFDGSGREGGELSYQDSFLSPFLLEENGFPRTSPMQVAVWKLLLMLLLLPLLLLLLLLLLLFFKRVLLLVVLCVDQTLEISV